MNDLKLVTKKTDAPQVFDTYWTTGWKAKGRVRVTVPNVDDGLTAAELAAANYLLTVKNVAGHNKSGTGLRIWVSRGAIKKLLRESSAKAYLVPYANFLRTRFLGALIEVEARDHSWADELCESQVDCLVVDKPTLTTIEIQGFGPVELTGHAIDQYIARFARQPDRAWRELVKIGLDAKPAHIEGRKAIHAAKHRKIGRFAMEPARDIMMAIVDSDIPGGLPRLVTVYRPGPNAKLTPEIDDELDDDETIIFA